MSKIIYYSFSDLEKLKSELNHLITVERISISQQIADARDKGDLSENAEYDAAKEAQGLLEMKISKLESQIASARVLDTSKLASDKVLLYSKIEIKNLTTGGILNYILVPDSETNIVEKKIAISSPIGKGLLGKKVGEVVKINIPAGSVNFEIISISR
ncbi:MAG: transcription elongation factor GreA [Flavobacteriales bacterium]|jgi:transcription elongation factor GreA|nr:transcription elongation factor GreA [Flavobacteriales bacterium]|tara:strand:+ start:339 stop:812 length:474 start_codon:yes stop_codon:yes gene_type:complete